MRGSLGRQVLVFFVGTAMVLMVNSLGRADSSPPNGFPPAHSNSVTAFPVEILSSSSNSSHQKKSDQQLDLNARIFPSRSEQVRSFFSLPEDDRMVMDGSLKLSLERLRRAEYQRPDEDSINRFVETGTERDSLFGFDCERSS